MLGISFAGDHYALALFHSKDSGLFAHLYLLALLHRYFVGELSGEIAYAHVCTREKKKNIVLIKPVTVHFQSLVSIIDSRYFLSCTPVLRVRITKFHICNSC